MPEQLTLQTITKGMVVKVGNRGVPWDVAAVSKHCAVLRGRGHYVNGKGRPIKYLFSGDFNKGVTEVTVDE